MEEVLTISSSNNVEVIKKAKKWILAAFYCSIFVPFIPILAPILLCIGFNKLKKHNFKSISSYAHLMQVYALMPLITFIILGLLPLMMNGLVNNASGPDAATPGVGTSVLGIWILLAPILLVPIAAIGGYIACLAHSALLKNPQIESQYKNTIKKLYLSIFFLNPIFILMNGLLFVFAIPLIRYHKRLFAHFEEVAMDEEASPIFDWKDCLRHPSFIEKGYFISKAILIILLALTSVFFI